MTLFEDMLSLYMVSLKSCSFQESTNDFKLELTVLLILLHWESDWACMSRFPWTYTGTHTQAYTGAHRHAHTQTHRHVHTWTHTYKHILLASVLALSGNSCNIHILLCPQAASGVECNKVYVGEVQDSLMVRINLSSKRSLFQLLHAVLHECMVLPPW